LQPIFEIQDGGGRHLEFEEICNFDATLTFNVRFSTFSLNLMKIGSILSKWQLIFEIQDGVGSHLGKYTSG